MRTLQSNDRLELVRRQAEVVLRLPASASAPEGGAAAAAATAELALRGLVADLLAELAGKYQQVNELKTDKLLSDSALAGGGAGAAGGARTAAAAQAALAAGADNVRSMLGRFMAPGSAAAAPDAGAVAVPPGNGAQQQQQQNSPGPQLLGGLSEGMSSLGAMWGRGTAAGRPGGQPQQPPPHP